MDSKQLFPITAEERQALIQKLSNRLLNDMALPKPCFLELMLTEDCNLRCSYCFVRDKNPRRMSGEIAIRAIDFFYDACGGAKNLIVLFFGGEPLLEIERIREVVKYADALAKASGKTISYNMTTNGTLIDEDMAINLAKHKIKYLVSVDGRQEVHDCHRRTRDDKPSFHLIANNMKHMKRYQPWQGARMTVHPNYVDSLVSGVKNLYNVGFNQFIIGPAMAPDIPWDTNTMKCFEEQLDELVTLYIQMLHEKKHFRLHLLEWGEIDAGRNNNEEIDEEDCRKPYENEWGCGAGRGRISVSAAGDLYGCSRLMTINGLSREGVGKIGNIWDGIEPIARAKLSRKNEAGRKKCLSCNMRDGCAGGCPAVNYQYTGSMYDPCPLDCQFVQMYAAAKNKAMKLAKDKNHTNPMVPTTAPDLL